MKCNHKYVDMEDGTRDKFCVRCGKKAKQGVLYLEPTMDSKIETQINNINENATDRIAKEIERGIALNKALGR